ncbi:MAG: SRPBCC family protein [Actinomycetales bacterium]|jgi:hypothetical protein|uniref:SRPBCC family protein n=1 Tax=Candidatus Phosphoribacter hodrii TaxID=2953743 RepID=A0A934X2Y0_9MICO|nr:SRPBCC family protein [Candidatus Phosphoribacter hodrii]MBP8838025.1 SRPBCC family protein [Dermatophilaceae bacterium]OPZ52891.1 MAG: Polyketide cyclase / dehydrase and lipid transport [bacterium ADurb.BinA028]MBK6301879.1 SRPBCC family protein [Candidatus Phosphoribacter hodrii]MBK7274764.1 SRPBCC family protein [Candidatus Phosphoribacter hodrii]
MSISVTSSTIVNPSLAWQVLSDVRSWPEWLPTVIEVVPETPEAPDGMGAAYLVRQPRLAAARWEITEWRPGAGFTWVSRRPGVTTTGTHQLVEVPGGVQAQLGIAWSGPLAWLVRASYGGLTRGYVASEAAAIVAQCQVQQSEGETAQTSQ